MTHANRPTTPCRLWDRRRLPLAVARLLPASLAATARANSAPPPVRAHHSSHPRVRQHVVRRRSAVPGLPAPTSGFPVGRPAIPGPSARVQRLPAVRQRRARLPASAAPRACVPCAVRVLLTCVCFPRAF
ncbi:atherin-like [Iris pallida]|uniref:Atherin-like n=1 Tax=Iris pallida TaxID=29817 RepID=A0AAX6DIF8_IRIPA|nr:atherin-like [Iris pallida]